MEEERAETFNDLTADDIKSYMENKEFDNVIKLTKNIYDNDMNNNDVFLKARYSCLIERNQYDKIIYEIMHCLIKLDKKKNRKKGNSNFKKIFQENYKEIQNKNVLFELFYSMYKLRKFKKLYGCLKYFIENENKYQDFIDMLYAQVNIILHKYNNSIHYFEVLLNNKSRQTTAHVNLNSSYFSQFMKFMYTYNFLRRSKKEKTNKNNNNKLNSGDDYQKDDENAVETFYVDGERLDTNDIEELKNQIIRSTKNFNYEQNQNFEEIFNYTTFFIMEKNYSEAMKFIEVLEDMCLNIESDNDINESKDINSNEDEEITDGIKDTNSNNNDNNDNINHNNNNNNNNYYYDLNINFCRKEIFIQLQKAYIYSKMKKIKESIRIYERILNQYDNVKNNKIVILIAYNNYIALMHNDNQLKLDIKQNKNIQDQYALTFHISVEKLSEIKNFLFTNNIMDKQVQMNNSNNNNNNNNYSNNNNINNHHNNNYYTNITTHSNSIFNNMNEFMFSTICFNECIAHLTSEQKDEFKMKLKCFSTRFSNSILLDKLIILELKNRNYMKCKSYIYNRINLMNSFENQIKFINAYIYLCYEKKNFKEIVKIYLMYEYLFQNNVKHYSSFFTNLFYIYICCTDYYTKDEHGDQNIVHVEKTKKQTDQIYENNNNIHNLTNNLSLVLDLFYKYKEIIQENPDIINYETLYLVCKYLLHHNKEQLVQELFDYLCEHEKNNLDFIACFTYIYTYINVSNAYTYENKLKKLVLTETYLIDVEELENTNIPFDKINLNNNISHMNDIQVEKKKNRKKRKRSCKKKKLTDPSSANLNPDRWLPKHEKPEFKKLKKKKKKSETLKQKVVVEVEETKTTLKQNKLQNLKKRRKK
ncbi:conserved Plasmodium protein, unknown function [Plasmodium reichenowi]|uniref:Signal recognition particle subunit SRP72 n=1 Tax=Plasmodium reichenowi TaxID=5854 RepID=A0A060RV13_PLARE|nr:conserved Plasmodium protein, unknown function [Plasmodium reichenowi]